MLQGMDRRGICIGWIVGLLGGVGPVWGQAADEPVARAEQIRRDMRTIQQQVLEHGSWQACSRRLQPWRQQLARRLANRPQPARGRTFIAKDAPLSGSDDRLLSARRAEQLLHDASFPSPDKRGTRRDELFYRAVVGLHRHLAQRGVDLIVVPVPDKSDIHPGDLGPLAAPAPPVQLQSKRLYLRLMRAGVEVVDLEPALSQAAQAGQGPPVYMLRDTHWSPVAAGIAAAELAKRLGRYDFVASSMARPPRFKSKAGLVVRRPGDLGRNWQAAGKKPFPVEKHRFSGFARLDGRGVDRAGGAPICVLGDSYAVFPYDGHLAFWAQLAGRINQPVAVDDKAGGASWQARHLHRTAAGAPGRKVVIWLFTNCSLYEQDFQPPGRTAKTPEAPGGQIVATVQLTAGAPKVDPQALAYANALVTLPAEVQTVIEGRFEGRKILLVAPLVQDRTPTAAAGWQRGRQLRVRLEAAVPEDQGAWMMFDETADFRTPVRYVAQAGPVE